MFKSKMEVESHTNLFFIIHANECFDHPFFPICHALYPPSSKIKSGY